MDGYIAGLPYISLSSDLPAPRWNPQVNEKEEARIAQERDEELKVTEPESLLVLPDLSKEEQACTAWRVLLTQLVIHWLILRARCSFFSCRMVWRPFVGESAVPIKL